MEEDPLIREDVKKPEKGNIAKWFEVKKIGKEREINLFVVVEMFRFIYHLWLLLFIITGVLLTVAFTEEDYTAMIKTIFGSINICVFLDFPPATYVLPSIYAIWPVIIFQYSIVSIFRAWIAREENKISICNFIFYSSVFIYFWLSSAIASTCFSVQPDLKKPETIIIHTVPFTNLVLSLAFLEVATIWFGFRVSWRHLSLPKPLQASNAVCLIGLLPSTVFKITQHINGLANLGDGLGEESGRINGYWWKVDDEVLGRMGQLMDCIWMIAVLLWPLLRSGYLLWRNFDTHGLVITIGDNREAKDAKNVMGNVDET